MGLQSTKPREVAPGDQIFRKIAGKNYHHGIYVGNDMVIHIQAPQKDVSKPPCPHCGYKADTNSRVVKTCLICFLSGQEQLYIRVYDKKCSKAPEEVVKTAFDHIETGFGPYDLVINNCEHFAVFCKTGKARSEQVRSAEAEAARAVSWVLGVPRLVTACSPMYGK